MLPRLAIVSTVAALFSVAAADFGITAPGPNLWWVAKSINTLTWSCKDNPPHDTFTVLVANKDPKVLTSPIAIIGVQQNFDCSKTITPDQVSQPPGTGYTIQFASILNQTDVFATSQEFEIKPLGSSYPAQSTPTTSGGSGANSTGTTSGAAPSKTNTATSFGSSLAFGLVAVGAVLGFVTA